MNRFPSSPRGAALIVVLVLVSAIALVVISLYAVTRSEAQLSGSRIADTRAHLAERAAFEDAKNLLASLTANDHYLVTSAMDPTSPGTAGARYTFLITPSADGLEQTPLFAGGVAKSVGMPDLDGTRTDVLADGALVAPEIDFDNGDTVQGIETYGLLHLADSGDVIPEDRKPKTVLQEIVPRAGDRFVQRYTWWIEDLEGYPNLDAVGGWTDHYESSNDRLALDFVRPGYSSHDPRTLPDSPDDPRGARITTTENGPFAWQFPKSFRGQLFTDQVAPGLSTREIILQPWATSELSQSDHPYASATEAISARHWGPVYPSAGTIGHETGHRYAIGLRPYLAIPIIPFGHGYADEGKPRHLLNLLVANRDMQIAEIITRNLPAFDDRKGAFPSTESYVHTLAANAIDYADADRLPSSPGNTTNGADKKFRGVDAYSPVNEFFVRFRYKGYRDKGTSWELEFEAELFAEFWNTFNEDVEMSSASLDFSFLDGLEFRTETRWHRLPDEDIVQNDPKDIGFDVNLSPNEIRVLPLGTIVWKTTVAKATGLPSAFPVISGVQGTINSSARASYRMTLSGTLVDSRGRTEPATSTQPQHGFFFQRHSGDMVPDDFFMRVATGNRRLKGFGAIASRKGSHLGDPWMDYYSQSTLDNAVFRTSEYRNHSSPGLRNLSTEAMNSRSSDKKDLYADQIRVREWPDGGYDNALAVDASGEFGSGFGRTPRSDEDVPTDFPLPTDPNRAPWRISNLGRFFSVTELGNLHDPVMWVYGDVGGGSDVTNSIEDQDYSDYRSIHLKSLPSDASSSPLWGGGNTLRIGRPEHELFDQPGMRASQLLDLFHAGENGSNLRAVDGDDNMLYAHYDPRDHQPPPTAPNAVEAEREPYTRVHDTRLHAHSPFRRIYGHLNINSAPTRFEIETMLRGSLVSAGLLVEQDSEITPLYTDETELGRLAKTLNEDSISKVAADLFRARPFVGPSHLARVLSHSLEGHDALPKHCNDAEAEETFARLFNTTSFSSRHFRIFTYAETAHSETKVVFARHRRVYEVFAEPIREADGTISRVRLQVLSSRDL